jgi:hypothetical protein
MSVLLRRTATAAPSGDAAQLRHMHIDLELACGYAAKAVV